MPASGSIRKGCFASATALTFLAAVSPDAVFPHILTSNDKALHALVFAGLTLLARQSFPGWPRVALAVGLAVFGGLIELVQLLPQLARQASMADWAVDCLAILAALALLDIVGLRPQQH